MSVVKNQLQGVKHNLALILMVGLPGSGKTTFINTFSQYITQKAQEERSQYDIHVIAYDELIPVDVQKGDSDLASWKGARKNVMQQVETLVKTLKENNESKSEEENILIFIDDNMYYRSMRYMYFQLARSYGVSFCQLYMSCTMKEAIENNNRRSCNCVPSEIIKVMSTKLQPPDIVHNKWESCSLSLAWDNVDIESVFQFIKSSLNCPVPPIVERLSEVKPSLIHDVDLELRRIVGQVMRDTCGNKEQLQALAKSLNATRHGVLDRLRAGDITLPQENMSHFLALQMDCGTDHCSKSSERS